MRKDVKSIKKYPKVPLWATLYENCCLRSLKTARSLDCPSLFAIISWQRSAAAWSLTCIAHVLRNDFWNVRSEDWWWLYYSDYGWLGFKRRHFSLCGAPTGFETLSGTSVHESMPLFSSGIDYSEIGSPPSQSDFFRVPTGAKDI